MRRTGTDRKQSQTLTRERLKHSARAEFARRGIAAASIDRISENAGFSRGAFYANYAGKHELLLELLEVHQTREIEAWQALLDSSGSLGDVLPALRDRFDMFAAHADDFLFATELQIEALRNPAIAGRYREYAGDIASRTRKLAGAFIARAGGSRVSTEVLGLMLQSLAQQLITEARLGLGDNTQSAGERMVAIIMQLLGTSPDAA